MNCVPPVIFCFPQSSIIIHIIHDDVRSMISGSILNTYDLERMARISQNKLSLKTNLLKLFEYYSVWHVIRSILLAELMAQIFYSQKLIYIQILTFQMRILALSTMWITLILVAACSAPLPPQKIDFQNAYSTQSGLQSFLYPDGVMLSISLNGTTVFLSTRTTSTIISSLTIPNGTSLSSCSQSFNNSNTGGTYSILCLDSSNRKVYAIQKSSQNILTAVMVYQGINIISDVNFLIFNGIDYAMLVIDPTSVKIMIGNIISNPPITSTTIQNAMSPNLILFASIISNKKCVIYFTNYSIFELTIQSNYTINSSIGSVVFTSTTQYLYDQPNLGSIFYANNHVFTQDWLNNNIMAYNFTDNTETIISIGSITESISSIVSLGGYTYIFLYTSMMTTFYNTSTNILSLISTQSYPTGTSYSFTPLFIDLNSNYMMIYDAATGNMFKLSYCSGKSSLGTNIYGDYGCIPYPCSGGCSQCPQGPQLCYAQSSFPCTPTSPSCLSCPFNGALSYCTQCTLGQTTLLDGSCGLCNITNCQICSSSNICQSCNPGINLINNTCTIINGPNCNVSVFNYHCQVCQNGTKLNTANGACQIPPQSTQEITIEILKKIISYLQAATEAVCTFNFLSILVQDFIFFMLTNDDLFLYLYISHNFKNLSIFSTYFQYMKDARKNTVTFCQYFLNLIGITLPFIQNNPKAQKLTPQIILEIDGQSTQFLRNQSQYFFCVLILYLIVLAFLAIIYQILELIIEKRYAKIENCAIKTLHRKISVTLSLPNALNFLVLAFMTEIIRQACLQTNNFSLQSFFWDKISLLVCYFSFGFLLLSSFFLVWYVKRSAKKEVEHMDRSTKGIYGYYFLTYTKTIILTIVQSIPISYHLRIGLLIFSKLLILIVIFMVRKNYRIKFIFFLDVFYYLAFIFIDICLILDTMSIEVMSPKGLEIQQLSIILGMLLVPPLQGTVATYKFLVDVYLFFKNICCRSYEESTSIERERPAGKRKKCILPFVSSTGFNNNAISDQLNRQPKNAINAVTPITVKKQMKVKKQRFIQFTEKVRKDSTPSHRDDLTNHRNLFTVKKKQLR